MFKKKQITIVTISYNMAHELKMTIKSVLDQTLSDFEYVIIDGGSSDSSVDIIRMYEKKAEEKGVAFRWVSEKDRGIYDAMNKGLDYSTGQWVNFMNAGDKFHDNTVLENILDYLSPHNDVVYGNTLYSNNEMKWVKYPRNLKTFYKGMPFCHQSCFVQMVHLKEFGFSDKYKIAGDLDLFLKLYKKKLSFLYCDLLISEFDRSGVSNSQWYTALNENYLVIKDNAPETMFFWFLNVGLSLLKRNIKKILRIKK